MQLKLAKNEENYKFKLQPITKIMICKLEVLYFATSIYKSTKHFGLSFTYDAPKIWNDLSDDVCSATSLHSFRKKLKNYLFAKA